MHLDELIRSDIYDSSQILAGAEGMSRQVETVNIMDTPDIIHFLKPNELLLTNGFFFKAAPDTLPKLISDMQQLKCSGIAIKTKRFGITIPDDVIAEAERLQFPIIEISDSKLSLGEILQRSTSLILDNKNEELQYALHIHKRFCDMSMQGKSIADLVAALAKLLSSPIVLLNDKRQLIASSNLPFSQLEEITRMIGSALDSTQFGTASSTFCLLETRFRHYSHVLLYPVHTYRLEGYLLSFHGSPSPSSRYGLTMEQAVNVIGMELTKAQAVKERSRRYKNEFFSDLIEGYYSTEAEVFHSGKKFGLTPNVNWVVVTARIDEPDRTRSLHKRGSNLNELSISERDVQYEFIKWQLQGLRYPFKMFTKNDNFAILLAIDEITWNEPLLIEELRGRVDALFNDAGISISIGIGNLVTSVLDIGLSYNEAVKALQYGYQMNMYRFVESFQSKDTAYLFRMLPHDELRQFYEDTLRSFYQVDPQEREELLRTLRVFYDTQCQLVETSKQLYVHRNTVVYRLDKCEKITGLRLKDPSTSLRFRMAFAIEPMIFPQGGS